MRSDFPVITPSVRWAWCFLAVMTGGFAAEPAGRRTLDAQRYHLGTTGLPEWTEFANSTPHGRQLDITFQARANRLENTLFIRQRNVKGAWNVMLNGQRIGGFEMLSQPLIRAIAIPAGALRDGANQLAIVPPAILDDIVAGEILFDPRPLADVLGEATVEIEVTETGSGAALPCRLTIADAEGALVPLQALPGQSLSVRTGVVFTGDGKARLGLPAGSYTIHATRGFEYDAPAHRVTLAAGSNTPLRFQLRREVDTAGLIAADSHIHTRTHSGHGDAAIDERMLTIAGEGIELAVATDHNHHTDFGPSAARMRVERRFTSVVGNEVTTSFGHFNAFPVPPGGELPDAKQTDWARLLRNIRTVTGAKVITLNHPRDLHSNFTPFLSERFNPQTGEVAAGFDCDAIEVVTSAAMQSDIMQLYRDWFALLNHGLRVFAVAASDTHDVSRFILGQARTYVAADPDTVAGLELEQVWDSYRSGRLHVSLGLLTRMTVNDRFAVGDLVTRAGDEIKVTVTVHGPSWVTADRVELFANGIRIREQPIVASREVKKATVEWRIPRPAHDVHLVAIATGPRVQAPYWEDPRPPQPTSKVFNPRVIGSTNPIWIDADDDGTFKSARSYAALVVSQAAGNPEKLVELLAPCDEAIALQAADLWRAAGHDLRSAELESALARAPEKTRNGFTRLGQQTNPGAKR
jgi:hypothetical protein